MIKRSVWLALFFLLTCSMVQAQDELQDQFNQIIDLINCQVAGISLADQDGGEAPFLPAFQEFFNCEGGDQNNEELQSFLKVRDLNLTLALNEQVDSFKLRYESTASTAELRTLIEEQLLNQQLGAFEQKHPLSFGQMRMELGPILDAFLPKAAPSELTATIEQPERSKKLGKKTESGDTKPNFWPLFALIAALIGVVVFFYLRQQRQKSVTPQKQSNPNPQFEIENMQNYDQDIRRLKEENHHLRSEVDLLKEQVRLIHEELALLKSKAIQEKPEPPDQVDRPVEDPIAQLPVSRKFYMRTPHPDG
ncbi:MAG: hypothetical protein AAF598_09850, partial [Bacteroidota bacterium]